MIVNKTVVFYNLFLIAAFALNHYAPYIPAELLAGLASALFGINVALPPVLNRK
jgi:hypothetical protein